MCPFHLRSSVINNPRIVAFPTWSMFVSPTEMGGGGIGLISSELRDHATSLYFDGLRFKFKFVTSELYIGFTQLFLVRLTLLRSSLYNDWLFCARAFSLFLNQSFKLLLIQGRSLLWTFIAFSGAKVFKLSFIIFVKLLKFCSQDRFGETTCQQVPWGFTLKSSKAAFTT